MSGAALHMRAYAGAADLRRMQVAVSRSFGRGTFHPGDLAWAMRDAGHVALAPLVTLLEAEAGGELVGYTWFHLNGWFDPVPLVPLDARLAEALVEAAMESAARCAAAGDVLERLTAVCDVEDEALIAALERRGFAPIEGMLEATRRSLDDLPAVGVPDGLRLSGATDDALVAARVECHRAAFAPSSLGYPGFVRVRRTWPYRPELDRVVVAEDGTVVAACLAWIDEATGWGLLEPVGTRPEHRRRGLAAAVCLDALHALRAAGARHVQVCCEGGSAGCATYHSIGFTTARTFRMLRFTP